MSGERIDSTGSFQASRDAGNGPSRTVLELADLADEILQELAEMRRHYQGLERLLESIAPAEPAGAPSARPGGGTPGSSARASGEEPNPDRSVAENIARTAALSGASREKVELYLRELGLREGAAAVEEVFRDAPPKTKRFR